MLAITTTQFCTERNRGSEEQRSTHQDHGIDRCQSQTGETLESRLLPSSCEFFSQNRSLKTTGMDSLTVLGARGPKARCQQGWFLPETLRKNPRFQLAVAARNPWRFLSL